MPMSKKYKDNVIPFPNRKVEQIQQKLNESRDAVEYLTTESVDTSTYMMDVMESELQFMEESIFSRCNFRSKDAPESKDMFVILNLINAMFHRYAGLPHHLQLELDDLFKLINNFELADNPEFDILFDPDFGIPLDKDESGLEDDDDDNS